MSIQERKMLLNFSKRLVNDSIVLELNSGLGGRAAIISRSNPSVKIYSVEEFHNGVLKNEFQSSESWISDQIVDFAIENDISREAALKFLNRVEKSFEEDMSGRQAWNIITENYSNISVLNTLNEFKEVLDFCLIKIHHNPMLQNNLDIVVDLLKPNGYLMAHLYDEDYCPDVFNAVNTLISKGWKYIRKVDKLILIQKP